MRRPIKIVILLICLVLVGSALHESYLRYRIEKTYPPIGEFVDVELARLHYLHRQKTSSSDAKTPAIVLIHGASGNARDMAHVFFNSLPPELDVYAFDRPGIGWSVNKISQEQMSSPAAQSDALAQAIDKLGLEKPLIVGFSWGGAVAAAFATRHPDKVCGVAALAGVFYPWDGTDVWYQKLAETPVLNQVFMRLLLVKMGRQLVPSSIEGTFVPETPTDDYRTKAAIDLILRPQPFINNSIYGMRLRGHLADMAGEYDSISVPVLLAAGDRDRTVFTPNQSQRLSKTVKQAHFLHFKGAGHMLHHTRTERITRAIVDMAHGKTLPPGEHYISIP